MFQVIDLDADGGFEGERYIFTVQMDEKKLAFTAHELKEILKSAQMDFEEKQQKKVLNRSPKKSPKNKDILVSEMIEASVSGEGDDRLEN